MKARPIYAQPKIWIDATGCFIWGNQPPTGIARVEATVLQAALDTPEIGIAFLDNDFRRYRPVGPNEMLYLKEILDGVVSSAKGEGQKLSGLARLRAQMRFFTQETARRWAASITGRQDRRGVAYAILKTAIRAGVSAVNLLFSPFPRLWSLAAAGSIVPEIGIPGGSMVLVSHVVDRRSECIASLRARRLRATHIVHDIIPLNFPDLANRRNNKTLQRFVDMVLERGDGIVTISQATHDDLVEWIGRARPSVRLPVIKACRLDCVGIATDGPESPIAVAKGRRFAIFCSTFDTRKNHDFLVHLWRRLHDRMGADTPRLLLVGRDGRGTARFRAALAEAGEAAKFIHPMGTIGEPALRWAYRNAAFGVYPSSHEGWGLGVSECLQFGTPVLHTDTPQLREAAHGVMPTLPDRDLDAWTDAVLRIAENESELDALRSIAAKDFHRHSSGEFAKCVIATLREYERATATR